MRWIKIYEEFSFDEDIVLVKDKISKYLQSIDLVDDEKLRNWSGLEVGSKVVVTDSNIDLPESQVTPSNGIYTLEIISIQKTDHYLMGSVTRKYFDEDDYDNWQSEHLNRLKSTFDTEERKPIIAIEDKDGLYSVIDGHHRIVIADELGRKSILALVIKNKSEKKMSYQSDLENIAKRYISAKNGQWKYNRDKMQDYVNWIDSLFK